MPLAVALWTCSSNASRRCRRKSTSSRRGKKPCKPKLRAQFLRIKSRRGAKKGILAVASSMLTAAYFMLRDGVEYHDLGSHHFDQCDTDQLAKRLLQRLRDLGVAVEVKAA